MKYRPDTAVVTGAAGGLGRVLVAELLAEGVQVVGCDRDVEAAAAWASDLSTTYPGSFRLARLDVTDEAAVAELAEELAGDGHPVSYLVNNAGVQAQSPLDELTTRRWQLVVDVNLLGTFLLTRQFSAGMATRGFGRIVNLSSYYASHPARGQSAYAASKAAVVGFTRSVALDLAAAGVTANVVSPGLVWHSNLERVWTEQQFRELAADVPVGRVGRPAEVTSAIRYLLSDESSYVTGQVLHVNGGLHLG